MQKLLFRATASLIILFTLLIGVIRFAGSTAAPPPLFSFDPPGCYLPCVFGITPGKTTWDDYKALVAAKVPAAQQTWGDDFDFWLSGGDNGKVEIRGRYYGNVQSKTLSLLYLFAYKSDMTTLGNLIIRQHMPVRVFRYQVFGPGGVLLVFVFGTDQQLVARAWATESVNPNTEIDWLAMINQPETLDDVLVDMNMMRVDEIRWLGFASVDRYLDEPAQQ